MSRLGQNRQQICALSRRIGSQHNTLATSYDHSRMEVSTKMANQDMEYSSWIAIIQPSMKSVPIQDIIMILISSMQNKRMPIQIRKRWDQITEKKLKFWIMQRTRGKITETQVEEIQLKRWAIALVRFASSVSSHTVRKFVDRVNSKNNDLLWGYYSHTRKGQRRKESPRSGESSPSSSSNGQRRKGQRRKESPRSGGSSPSSSSNGQRRKGQRRKESPRSGESSPSSSSNGQRRKGQRRKESPRSGGSSPSSSSNGQRRKGQRRKESPRSGESASNGSSKVITKRNK
eukprot:575529_1